MTSDIFTLLQSYVNVQTMQPLVQETPPDGTGIQSGLFASLMNECIAEGEDADFPVQRLVAPENVLTVPKNRLVIPENTSEPHTIAFTGSRTFPQSVMSILAGEAEPHTEPESAQTMLFPDNELTSQKTPDDSDIVIWPEDEAAMTPASITAENESPAKINRPAKSELPAVNEPPVNESPVVSDLPSENEAPAKNEPIAENKLPLLDEAPVMSEFPAENEPQAKIELTAKGELPAERATPSKADSELPAEYEPIAENKLPLLDEAPVMSEFPAEDEPQAKIELTAKGELPAERAIPSKADSELPAEYEPIAENKLPPVNETHVVNEPPAKADTVLPTESKLPAEAEKKLPAKSEFPAKNDSPAKSELPAENEPLAENELPADRIILRVKNLVQEKSQTTVLTDSDVQETAEQVIAEEGLDELPEGLKQETSRVLKDFAAELKREENTDTQPLVRILDAVIAQTAPKPAPKSPEAPAKSVNILDETEDSRKTDQTQETPEVITRFARAAENTTLQPQTKVQPEIQDTRVQIQPEHQAAESQPVHQRRPQTETHSQPVMSIPAEEPESKPETESAETMPMPENVMPVPENVLTSPETQDDSDIVIWPEDEQATKPEGIPSENEPLAENEAPADRIIIRVKNLVQEKSHTTLLTDSDVQETAEQVIAEEGLNELPEALKQETELILKDFAAELKRWDNADSQPLVRILEAITVQTAPKPAPKSPETPAPKSPEAPAKSVNTPDETEDSRKPDQTQETPEVITRFARAAENTTLQPQTTGQPEIQDTRVQIQPEHQAAESQPVHQRKPQTETHSQPVMSIPVEQTKPKPETESAETMPMPENVMPVPENVLTSPETQDDSDIVVWPEDEQATKPEGIPSENKPTAENKPIAENEAPADRIIIRVKNLVQEKSQTTVLTDSDFQEMTEHVIAEERLDDIPEALKQETSHILKDFAAELKHEDNPDAQLIVRILEAVIAQTAPKPTPKSPEAPAKSVNTPDEIEDSHEPQETPEIPEGITDFAGLAGITNPQPQVQQQPAASGQPLPESQPIRPQRPRTEVQDSLPQPEHRTEESQPDRPQRPHAETHQQPREHQEPQPSGQTQSQSQSQNQSRNQSQTLKPETKTQKTEAPAPKSEAGTRKTESRSDFAAFFEGVLNSRRTTSRTSAPMPLNLRTAENFPQTQSVRLREGITNVVRFIRADGVQKARVVIDPPALGRISVELTSGTSGVEASIKVASEQIRQLVQEQISQLRMNLSQQGVQVSEFTVDVQQDNSGNHGQQGQQQNTGRFGFMDDSDDDEAEDFRIDLEEGLLWWVA